MKGIVNSPEPIQDIQYFTRATGIADVYLHKNAQEPVPGIEEEEGSQYTAEEVYFMVTAGKATQEQITADFDYWYEKCADLPEGELADKYCLEEQRRRKYLEVSEACEKTIYAGVDVDISTGKEHFSLTEKDQINLFGKKMQLLAGEEKMEYHEDGQPCRYFIPADMQKIVDTAMFYVSYNTTYCNALNMWIKGAEKASDLENIAWGAEIPEEYQNEVLVDYMSYVAEMGGGAE